MHHNWLCIDWDIKTPMTTSYRSRDKTAYTIPSTYSMYYQALKLKGLDHAKLKYLEYSYVLFSLISVSLHISVHLKMSSYTLTWQFCLNRAQNSHLLLYNSLFLFTDCMHPVLSLRAHSSTTVLYVCEPICYFGVHTQSIVHPCVICSRSKLRPAASLAPCVPPVALASDCLL